MLKELKSLLELIDNSLVVEETQVKVVSETGLRNSINKLVEVSVLGDGVSQSWSRYLIRAAALEMGIFPASIHDLYIARGKGNVPLTFTVPAINLRALSFDAARAVFRSALKVDAGAFIFEIARSEIGYTMQRPAEYATNIFAAAIAEGFRGPIFIQGDHFQVSAKRYASEPESELGGLRDLMQEAISAGFFNIDVDSSTLVDIDLASVSEQQEVNIELSAMFAGFIRTLEPKGVTVSIGGEIGEVGGKNSTAEELRAYLKGFNERFAEKAPGKAGLSKISIQTGTSHGGVVLPDGTIAEAKVDFDTLRELSLVSRNEFGLGGTVQHGASTLPESAFGKFVENEAIEVHLATNFMTMFYDHIPDSLRNEMYVWLDENYSGDRKPGMTDEQFYYKTRKNALGSFKKEMYALSQSVKDELGHAWEAQFDRLFELLGMSGTRAYVDEYIETTLVPPVFADYIGQDAFEELADDLAD